MSFTIREANPGSRSESNSSITLWAVSKACFPGLLQLQTRVRSTTVLTPATSYHPPLERITLLVSDLERNQLYALTSRNSIAIYKPNSEKSVQHLQTMSNLYKAAQDKAPGSPALTPQHFLFISLHVVAPSESRTGIQLIAMTANGVRLFFGPSISYYGYSQPGAGSSPRPLSLLHVRLPPTTLIHPDEQASAYRPPRGVYGTGQATAQPTSRPYVVSSLDGSSYHNGLTIAAQQGDTDGTDYILCLSPDLTQIGNLGQLNPPTQQPPAQQYSSNAAAPTNNRLPLVEYATLLSIPGRTWAVANVINSPPPPLPSTTPSPSSINELATQFNGPAHQFMLLTNVGLTFLIKRRALDYLKAVLEELHSEGNVQPIIDFRDRYGVVSFLFGMATLLTPHAVVSDETKPVPCY